MSVMSTSRPDSIFTVVSRPGPVERAILERMSPAFSSTRRVGAGVSLRVVEGGEGPLVVLLHGRGHAATMWASMLGPLAARHRVLAIDLPGFGHSGARPFSGHGPSDGLRFFAEPIGDLIAAAAPPEGAIVIGHSLGGLVALSTALDRPKLVRGLGLVCAMGLGPEMSMRARLYLRSNPEAIARARSLVTRRPEHELDALRLELLGVRGGRPRARRAFDAMVPLIGPAFHLRDRLAEVKAPTLLVWGERDDAFPLPIAIDARARIPRATLAVLSTGHSPHVEDPLATLGAIEPWLAGLAPVPAVSSAEPDLRQP